MRIKTTLRRALAIILACSLAVLPTIITSAATPHGEVSEREKTNAALARQVATQGMILLENNDNALPLQTKKIAMFGGGAVRTVRGGTGSGDPFNGGLSGGGEANVNQSDRYHINALAAFEESGYEVTTKDILEEYAIGYDKQNALIAGDPMTTFVYPELNFTDEDLEAAADGTDTAIYVISRNAGEGADRSMTTMTEITYEDGTNESFEIGDYELTEMERENLARVGAKFDKVIVVLNVGGMMDTNFFSQIEGLDALLLMGQAGQESGMALMDVCSGAVTPSGKTISTWAKQYADYPASETFAQNDGESMIEFYNEGIYVGYRYFDTFGIEPAYPFGYGISYTDFAIEDVAVEADAKNITVSAKVTNIGDTYSGKEVVEIYYSAPDAEGPERAYQDLAAYAKTDELSPGESQTLTVTFATSAMATYDASKAAYVLEPGDYILRVGNSSRNTAVAAVLSLDGEVIAEQVSNQMEVPQEYLGEGGLMEISKAGATGYTYEGEADEIAAAPVITLAAADFETRMNISEFEDEAVVTYTTDPDYEPTQPYETVELVEDKPVTLLDVYEGNASYGELVAQMDAWSLAKFNCGSGWGVANEYTPVVGGSSETVPGAAGETVAYEDLAIPSIVSADGPGGVRVKQFYEATNEVTGEVSTYYQYATAWPVHYLLAQSWDTDVLNQVGLAFGVECAELNITTLLGPSINIWRDPLCGRNFEYFGEDPVIAGTMAAALTKGVQATPGVYACLKHYAANNQETNRSGTNSIISERALREIYLKGFKIAIEESRPGTIMTSYNQINGVPTADSYDLCTNLARGEWGFVGSIMTDWNGGVSHPAISMHAGNDLIMPGGTIRANDIMKGLSDYEPNFSENGQVGETELMNFGTIAFYTSDWGDFEPSADGSMEVTAALGDDYSAEATEDGQILVNGEPIYLYYNFDYATWTSNWETPVTTDVATVSEDGKSITYKGDFVDNNVICLGDLQKSAINNLLIIVGSNDMARQYGTTSVPYTEKFAEELIAYQSVEKQ